MASVNEVPLKTIEGQKVPFEVLGYIPEDSATYYQFVPMAIKDGVLEVGMVDPDNIEARDALQFIASRVNLPFKIYQISEEDFKKAIESYAGLGSQVTKALGDLDSEIASEAEASKKKDAPVAADKNPNIIEEAPVTKIVAVIIQHATSGNASDIHVEPTKDRVKVRFRVDGALYTSLFLPLAVHDAVVARIKILTNMRLDEKRKPQDGRFSAKVDNRAVDFRVSTLPTAFGEKVVIRILDPERKLVNLENLGLSSTNLNLMIRGAEKPYGLILVTGPTGSGKTTTLYSLLNRLEREKYNVVSLEDPIEYNIPGVSQSQVQPEIDYTFATGLRSILRQDPDIIMVGEIRDKETAKLAIQAALTGHLVFSTLHTNNAAGAIPRLVDMGVDPYLIAPTLVMAIAQRLVPTLCEDSKRSTPLEGGLKVMIEKQFADLPPETKKIIKIPDSIFHPVRSATCPGGTRGRTAVFEMFEMTPELEEVILKNPVEEEIYKVIRRQGFLTMKEDALLKSFAGIIPFAEVNKL